MPAPMGTSDLTGRTRHRGSLFGTLVLQVEERYVLFYSGVLSPFTERTPVFDVRWRDAKVRDLYLLNYLDRCAEAESSGKPKPTPPARI